ncbi:MAG: hypothetical protein OEY36_02095 [Gammaproteobacteria bacterium]|nr:hypothetical protein [Gammaproteobacteria bacterium]
MKTLRLIPLTLLAVLFGCQPNNPADSLPVNDLFQNSVSGTAAPLSSAEFNSLTPVQQYRVANKLLGTMFRGVSVNDFFDLSQGMDNLTLKDPDFLNTIAVKLITALPTVDDNLSPGQLSIDDYKNTIGRLGSINSLFSISELSRGAPQQVALAHTTQLPLSSDSFNNWIAYILANSILFSPAEEIDSTSALDTQAVYNRLVDQLTSGSSIASMILSHEQSPQNWRRFRSPEDNTREMIEIYLGVFVPEPDGSAENDVVNASIACQHLYLTDGEDGLPIYQLVSNGNYNTNDVLVLQTYITSCDDFYSLVAQHPKAMPRMVATIVETLMLDRSGADRALMIESISNANPQTFQEIFSAVIFSKEYLLYTERAKSFEENFYNMSARLKYKLPANHFVRTAACSQNNGCTNIQTFLGNMNWPSMTNKLGRLAGVPLDTLSFAHYHRGFRESMIIDTSDYSAGLISNPDSVQPDLEAVNDSIIDSGLVTSMNDTDYLKYLFLSMLERLPESDEVAQLTPLMAGQSQSARIVLDYISRLPEQYYFNCSKGIQPDPLNPPDGILIGECIR